MEQRFTKQWGRLRNVGKNESDLDHNRWHVNVCLSLSHRGIEEEDQGLILHPCGYSRVLVTGHQRTIALASFGLNPAPPHVEPAENKPPPSSIHGSTFICNSLLWCWEEAADAWAQMMKISKGESRDWICFPMVIQLPPTGQRQRGAIQEDVLDAGLPVHGATGGDISKCPYYAAKMISYVACTKSRSGHWLSWLAVWPVTSRPDRSVKKEEEMFLYLECGHFISRIYSRSNTRITSRWSHYDYISTHPHNTSVSNLVTLVCVMLKISDGRNKRIKCQEGVL
ncbi:unnamed protein product [Pleuronectes platessa]|uniref:Uncharacterized protein n=1 Tax=Pleuronectes platessa TaxID=8262 RepID=A0A9N7UIT5_PLEPL|nr:unnamed protein product [Pleuronectes platessa]